MPTARRPFIASLLAAPLWAQAVLAEPFAGTYRLAAQPVAPGVWMVRGADQPIAFANGGAIANAAIIATDAGAVLVDCGPSLAYGRALAALARRLTGQAVALVLITHLHPDHALGAGAFDPAIVAALPGTIADIRRDGPGMTDAMFRLLADWMRGTELAVPGRQVAAGPLVVGGRRLQLLALSGHSQADLAVPEQVEAARVAAAHRGRDRPLERLEVGDLDHRLFATSVAARPRPWTTSSTSAASITRGGITSSVSWRLFAQIASTPLRIVASMSS